METVHYILDSLLNGVMISAAALLPWLITAFVMQGISVSIRNNFANVKFYIYFTAPGVMIHELSHALFCILFGHEIVEMKLFSPENGKTLGYVRHSYDQKNIFHRIGNFFIGTGPVWGGIAVLWLLTHLLLPAFTLYGLKGDLEKIFLNTIAPEFWMSWKTWLWIYLAFAVVSHITLSVPDLQGAGDGLAAIVIIIMLGCLGAGWCGNWERTVINWLLDVFFRIFPPLLTIAVICGCCAVIVKILFGGMAKKSRQMKR